MQPKARRFCGRAPGGCGSLPGHARDNCTERDADPRPLSVAQLVKEKGCSSKNFLAAFSTLVAVWRPAPTPAPTQEERIGSGVVYMLRSPRSSSSAR